MGIKEKMATDWVELWQALNKRQQAYLQAIYKLDQANEHYYQHAWRVSHQGYPPPASQWRWIIYGPVYPMSNLEQALREQRLIDPGTGSTFESLDQRGYIERKWDEETLLSVKMTARGRRVIRAATGQPKRQKRPPGQLSKSQWRALKALYEAGQEGVRYSETGGYEYRHHRLSWPAMRRLRDYKPEPLMREDTKSERFTRLRDLHKPELGTYTETKMVSYAFITEAGIAFYEAHSASYEKLYPGLTF